VPEERDVTEALRSTESGFLAGVRVLEVADELGEYCGRLLAGLGADVIKVEPPSGEATRAFGPFYRDTPHRDRSLYFWHFNFGKRGVTLDLDEEGDRRRYLDLAKTVDVVIDSRPRGYLSDRSVGYEALRAHNRSVVYARISPFGDDGPWADFAASDLVHLALGGVMMNCGYDPEPSGFYDTPPIAPQMWQSYQIAGEHAGMAIIAALNYRLETGVGQLLSTSVHQAVSTNTETDLPNWIFLRQLHRRQTCRHSLPIAAPPAISRTKDGRWLLPYRTYLPGGRAFENTVDLLQAYGMEADLADAKYDDPAYRAEPNVVAHIGHVTDALIGRFKFDRNLWQEAQDLQLPWAPIRRPEENLGDDHWRRRDTFVPVHHPELGETFDYVRGKWRAEGIPWRSGPRAPLRGEHTEEVFAEAAGLAAAGRAEGSGSAPDAPMRPHGTPFALAGVRIIDLSWLLASAGSGRFFTSLGAEVIKVEHESRWDIMRFGQGVCPEGGREERDSASEAIPTPKGHTSPNRSGSFMEINAGKRSVSLNLKTDRGRELLTKLLEDADMVVEGFSPGTMGRMGFGYERLREINPRIIYVQQSGLGQHGTRDAMRSFGPTAAAFAGLSEMSGLPEPYPPAGIGYSYLDWFGAYNMATAMMAALYRQRVTGRGCYIDSSQVETGVYLTGPAILDAQVNGRQWQRIGNRSPYKLAAPHGTYRTRGEDRWIAVACFDDDSWIRLCTVLGEGWADDQRFATMDDRLARQDELDDLVNAATADWDGYQLMERLQAEGIPAGVCQTAADRVDRDPQLRHLEWLVELPQTEIGVWPVKQIPVKYSETPAYAGGFLGRSGPNYGEDNQHVYEELLGLGADEIEELRRAGVI
jgi:crotonobetainyl-CoA:carnitine CoA-transferase CaiB-like acyl-CoA transferase